MSEPRVKLIIDGTEHVGWIAVNLRRSLTSLSGSFELSMKPLERPYPKGWKIKPHEKCQVLLGDIPVITGIVESIQTQVASDHHMIHVRGRDLTADLIDCPSGLGGVSRQQTNLKEILDLLLSKFKISYVIEGGLVDKVHPAFHVNEFEGVFSALSRIANLDGILLLTNGEGQLVITRPQINATDKEQITEALSCEYIIDVQSRFSEYNMFIPSYAANAIQTESKLLAQSLDPSINRFRPYALSSEGYATPGTAKTRVIWENSVRKAKSEKLKLTLPTWKTKNGDLWKVNTPINASFPAVGVDGSFLISDVVFKLDQAGHQTYLECIPAQAFKTDPTLFIKENNLKDLITKVSQ